MAGHVHEASEQVHGWSGSWMRAHLLNGHGINPPMFLTTGELHRAHLEAHQKDVQQVWLDHPVEGSDRCGAYYGVGDGTATICNRPPGHPEVGEDGIGHSPQPIPIKRTTEQGETQMTMTDNENRVEIAARYLWMEAEDKRVPEGWNYIGQETRDQYRDRARINLAAKDEADAAERIAKARARNAAHPHEANLDIARDRLIAVMAGVDFDRDWAADDGMGRSARVALRRALGAQAERLLEWIERGGIMAIPVMDRFGKDYDKLREERDEALKQQQLAEGLVHDLEEVNNALRERLAESERARGRLFGELGNLRDEQAAALDAVQQQLGMTQTASTNLQKQVRDLTTERDAARAAANRVAQERDRAIGALRDRRDEALGRLGEVAGDLNTWRGELQDLKPGPDWHDINGEEIITRITDILGDDEQQALIGVVMPPESGPAEGADTLTWAKRFASGDGTL